MGGQISGQGDDGEQSRTSGQCASDLVDARDGDEAAGEMGGQVIGHGDDGEQSRTAGGDAGQHTTGATEPPEGMSSGD